MGFGWFILDRSKKPKRTKPDFPWIYYLTERVEQSAPLFWIVQLHQPTPLSEQNP
ncbi:hypothetical protein [Metabacillus sp. SLBN-84]